MRRSDCDELLLEHIENGLAHLARLRKLAHIVEVKVEHMEPGSLQASTLVDIEEIHDLALSAQQALCWLIVRRGLV